MRIALVCDDTLFNQEPDAFSNLIIGLINEQIDIVQIAPSSARSYVSEFGKQAYYKSSRFKKITNRNLRLLATKNSEDGGVADLEIDIVHALHSSVWAGAGKLAKKLNSAAAFNITNSKDIGKVKGLKKQLNPQQIALMSSTAPLYEAAKNKLNANELLVKNPPGVHLNKQQKPRRQINDPITAVVSGNGILDTHYKTFLKALSVVIANYPDSQFFFDGGQADQYRIWREAKKLNLLGSISLTPDNLTHREILLRADCIIHPQPLGKVESITLEAMAHGIVVIAQDDPWLDYLIDQQTAWVLDEPTTDDWVNKLLTLAKSPTQIDQLGASAQSWISQNALASARLAKTIDTYRRLTGESLPFRK